MTRLLDCRAESCHRRGDDSNWWAWRPHLSDGWKSGIDSSFFPAQTMRVGSDPAHRQTAFLTEMLASTAERCQETSAEEGNRGLAGRTCQMVGACKEVCEVSQCRP